MGLPSASYLHTDVDRTLHVVMSGESHKIARS